jgi:hypothetical protein
LLSAKKIPAGKSGQIEVRVKTEGMYGPVEKMINVTTNDPNHTVVALTVKANVEKEIGLSEPAIFFGNTPKGKEAVKELIITLPEQKPIAIRSVTSKDPNVTVKIEAIDGSGGKKFKLTAIQKANAIPGYHFGRIVVKTSSRMTPEISIYEQGVVVAPGK